MNRTARLLSGMTGAALAGLAAHDLRQRRHAILRNYPIVGHFRYLLESVGPELRQYIVTSNDEERPFSRDQRRWVYASSKREINTFGFGSDNDMEQVDSLIVFEQSPFPVPPPADEQPGGPPDYRLPAGKVLGAAHGRRHAFRRCTRSHSGATWSTSGGRRCWPSAASRPCAATPVAARPASRPTTAG